MGLPLAALSGLVLAAVGAGILHRARRTVEPEARSAYRLIAAGLMAGAVGLAGTAVLEFGPGWPVRLAPFAAGQAVGGVLLLAGLLRLPGVAGEPGTVPRHALDQRPADLPARHPAAGHARRRGDRRGHREPGPAAPHAARANLCEPRRDRAGRPVPAGRAPLRRRRRGRGAGWRVRPEPRRDGAIGAA